MTLPGGLSGFRNVVCLEHLQKMFILLTIETRHESPHKNLMYTPFPEMLTKRRAQDRHQQFRASVWLKLESENQCTQYMVNSKKNMGPAPTLRTSSTRLPSHHEKEFKMPIVMVKQAKQNHPTVLHKRKIQSQTILAI